MMQFNGVMFRMTRQFLDMGISEIDPESVKWTGDTFSATLDNGYPRYGKLSISNGPSFKLEISVTKDSLPYKMVEYTCPNSSASLGGFPSRMRISDGSDGKWKPVGEVTFYSVDLARRPLSENYFFSAQFVGINIAYTNIYISRPLCWKQQRSDCERRICSKIRWIYELTCPSTYFSIVCVVSHCSHYIFHFAT